MNDAEVWSLLLASFPQISAGHLCVGTVCSGLYRNVHSDIWGLKNSRESVKT